MPGGIINASTLTGVFLNLKTNFHRALDVTKVRWQKTATLIPVTGLSVEFPWMDVFPNMIEWVGSKNHRALAAYAYTLQMKEWEATIDIHRKYIEADQIGMFGQRATGAGMSAAKWPDQRINAVKNAAFTTLSVDGQYHYDTDHLVAGASVSNKLTATLSAASKAAAAAGYGAARLAMMGFTDAEGNALELIPDLLEVPPALETTANHLMTNDKFEDDTPNPYKGQCQVEVNPGLTSSTAWFLHCTTAPIMPFIFCQRKAPVFVQMTDMNSPQVFDQALYSYGAEASGIGGYGPWQLSVGSTGEG